MAKRLYTVREGESLSVIARDELGDINRWPELAYINSLSAPYTIFVGQTIMLPVDGDPLTFEITQYAPAPSNGTAATKTAAFELTPATLAIGLAVVAVLLLMEQK